MRPAICSVCHTLLAQSPKGEWVRFLDYKDLEDGEIGHPDGLEWFCESHIDAAKKRLNKSSTNAIEELKQKYRSA